jgi:acyl-CoA thioester hydrolase
MAEGGYVSSHNYRVSYADTDKMGVVYYANYLMFFERARTELLREAGLSYKALEESGIMLPVIEASCRYKSSAKYDDLLTLTAKVEEIKGVRVKISCEVLRDGELLVHGYTVHACVNNEGRLVKAPEELRHLAPR